MSSLTDTMKCMVDQIKGLQERLNIMESDRITAISSPQSILVSTFQGPPSTSRNWRDTYDPFGPSMLNPHNIGTTATEDHIDMAQTSVPFTLFGSFGLFGIGMIVRTTTQASGCREQQSVQHNVFS